jgi:hypothetical protein
MADFVLTRKCAAIMLLQSELAATPGIDLKFNIYEMGYPVNSWVPGKEADDGCDRNHEELQRSSSERHFWTKKMYDVKKAA